MSTTVQRYAGQCLAGSGIAVMNSTIAWQLRPDLWGSGQDCAMGGGWRMNMPGTQAMEADIEGMGPVRVLARSQDMLAERIGWIVGARVKSVKPVVELAAAPVRNRMQTEVERRAADEQARLHRLAAQEPPDHACQLRKEILDARQALGITGT